MNILPGLFRGGADICVPLVRLFFVEMTRPSIYNIEIPDVSIIVIFGGMP